MMPDPFAALSKAKSNMIAGVARSVGLWLAAVLALLAGIAMFAIAALLKFSALYDPVTAYLIVGGTFIVVAMACVGVNAWLSKRRRVRTPPPAPRSILLEPGVVAAGIDVARMIGGKRGASLAAGAAAIYWLVTKDGARARAEAPLRARRYRETP